MGMPISVLQETKVTARKHTRCTSGYTVFATDAPSAYQGSVALLWVEDHAAFEVEFAKVCSPNVITFQLVTVRGRYFVVGCYIAPGDEATVEVVRMAWDE